MIPSVTRPFCDACDRIRLTADGQLRSCLFAVDEIDLRDLVRGGAPDDELAAAIRRLRRRQGGRPQIGQVAVRPARGAA